MGWIMSDQFCRLIACWGVLLGGEAAQPAPRMLFNATVDVPVAQGVFDDASLRDRLVSLDTVAIETLFAGGNVTANFFEDQQFQLDGGQVERQGAARTWVGRLAGERFGAAIVFQEFGLTSIGVWSNRGGRFEAIPISRDVWRITQYDDTEFRGCGVLDERPASIASRSSAVNNGDCFPTPDQGEFIDLLVVYSRDVGRLVGPLGLRARAHLQIALGNLALSNSLLDTPRFRLAGVCELDLEESTPCSYCDPDLCPSCLNCSLEPCDQRLALPCKGATQLALLNQGEPPFDQAHAWRNLAGADVIVCVLDHVRKGCRANSDPLDGIADRNVIVDDLMSALGHELGHVFDIFHAEGPPPHRARVYLKPGDADNTDGENFRTVVASPADLGPGEFAPPIPYFSHPDVFYSRSGVFTGDATRNAAAAIALRRAEISQRRDSADCDADSIPDECEIAANPALDCNSNGIVDVMGEGQVTWCEVDCDANGRPDSCDITEDPSRDCNLDGLLDACFSSVCRAARVAPPLTLVDLLDIQIALAGYGHCRGDSAYSCAADVDLSGCVDLHDLSAVISALGDACAE